MDFIKGNEHVKIDPSGIDITGTSNIVIKSEGKIGIGTNNPQHPLQVNGSHAIFSNSPEILLFKQEGQGRLGSTLNWGTKNYTDWKIKAEDSGLKFMRGINDNTYEKLSLLNDGTIEISSDVSLNGDLSLNGDIEISGNNKFVVTDTGNIGIGTTNPVEKLDVDGNILIKSTTSENTAKLIIQNPKNLDGTTEKKISSIEFAGDINHRYTGSGAVLALASEIACLTDFPSSGSDADESRYSLVFKTRQRDRRDGAIYDNLTEAMRISGSGYVGVFGVTDPKYPLHIQGNYSTETGITTQYTSGSVGWNNGDWGYSSSWAPEAVAIRAIGSIWISNGGVGHPSGQNGPSHYLNSSDRRIKTDISLIDDSIALDQVNQLESHQYNYISGKKPMKTIGFIAQEVKEVVPNAVSLQTEYIPDEMRIITEPVWSQDASNNWLLEIPDLDMSGNFTGKAKFYVSNDPSGNDEVCKEVQIKEVDGSTPLFTKTKFVAEFDQSWNNVFFYGKEVSDFHTLDKNQIFALHHSAIQELSRRNDKLQEENAIKTDKIASLESRIDAMESAILAMQALVESTIANA